TAAPSTATAKGLGWVRTDITSRDTPRLNTLRSRSCFVTCLPYGRVGALPQRERRPIPRSVEGQLEPRPAPSGGGVRRTGEVEDLSSEAGTEGRTTVVHQVEGERLHLAQVAH